MWNEFKLSGDLGKSWQLKIHFLLRKLRGWHSNYRGEKKRLKKEKLEELEDLDLIQEIKDLEDEEFHRSKECTIELDRIYTEEEMYWAQRARLKWLLEGDQNTKKFHTIANNRKREKLHIFLRNRRSSSI